MSELRTGSYSLSLSLSLFLFLFSSSCSSSSSYPPSFSSRIHSETDAGALRYHCNTDVEFQIKPITVWTVGDLESPQGQRAVFETLRRQLKGKVMRVAIVHSGASDSMVAHMVLGMQAALKPSKALTAIGQFLAGVLSGQTPEAALIHLSQNERNSGMILFCCFM